MEISDKVRESSYDYNYRLFSLSKGLDGGIEDKARGFGKYFGAALFGISGMIAFGVAQDIQRENVDLSETIAKVGLSLAAFGSSVQAYSMRRVFEGMKKVNLGSELRDEEAEIIDKYGKIAKISNIGTASSLFISGLAGTYSILSENVLLGSLVGSGLPVILLAGFKPYSFCQAATDYTLGRKRAK